ncbi:MAG: NAD(P)H-binding protein [Mycobacterium sp.]|uniref:NAD(P)H-binding protein n=1 Tax=Mycobacterium sp. TaxID=1785 RepID=UPI003F9958E1
MRILVTDATGGVGRLVARQLIAAGHAVSGIAEHPHARLDPGVELVCAPLRDPVLQELADQADAVVHLAPLDPTAPGNADLDGVAHVTDAAARAGARLLFVSHAAGQAHLYRPAEALVSSSWGPSLVVRIAPPVGRQLDWMVCRTVATLLRTKVSAQPIRVLHLDDLARFLVSALSTDRTGVVDLATPDTVNVITAWRMLRSVDPRSRLHHVRSWPQLDPDMDLSAVQEDWTFDFGWQAVEAVADTARGLVGRRIDAAGATGHGGQLVLPVEVLPRPLPSDDLRSAAPEGMEGEFDDRIDPRFPVFSATSLAGALPGPLTPLTLDVQLSGLRTAGRALGQVLALGGTVDEQWGSRAFAVFGHRAYVGVSANSAAAAQLPGWDGDVIARLPSGGPQPAGKAPGSIAKVAVAARSLALLRRLRSDTKAYVAVAESEHLDAAELASLPDAGLEVRLRLLRDRIHQGWILTALWLVDAGVTAAASGLGMIMDGRRVAAETAELAAALRADPPLCALARQGNLASIRALSPDTAAALDAAVARVGHRGPGEAELAGLMFGDDASTLLTMASELTETPEAPAAPADAVAPTPPATFARRLTGDARRSREVAHDTTLRFTHELRMTLRELGSRRAAGDVIDAADDVYYLTCDELVTLPADARLRIKRRRAERERLQAQRPPDVIDGTWSPVESGA